jgi:putative transposase
MEVMRMISELRQTQPIKCKFCRSAEVVRNGRRENNTQYWLCTNCGHGFIDNSALPGMKYSMDAVTSAVNQYFTGVPIGDICRYIENQTHNLPSYSTIYSWIRRISDTAHMVTKKYKPEVSDIWIADETILSLKGKKYWLIDLIDTETRFLLAVKLSHNRNKNDVNDLLEQAQNLTGKSPGLLIINGWKGYLEGLEAARRSRTKHLPTQITLESEKASFVERTNNGQINRFNIMRGLKKSDTAESVLPGWMMYYNYFRPHPSLNNITPAEKAHISFPFRNWREIVNSQVLVEAPVSMNPDGLGLALPIRKPYRKRTVKHPVKG